MPDPIIHRLEFSAPPNTTLPLTLIFGEPEADDPPVEIEDAILSISTQITSLTGEATIEYLSDTPRPEVGAVTSLWQDGKRTQVHFDSSWHQASPLPFGLRVCWQEAQELQRELIAAWSDALRSTRKTLDGVYQQALRVPTTPVASRFQRGAPLKMPLSARYQEALRLGALPLIGRYQESYRDRRSYIDTLYQAALRVVVGFGEYASDALRAQHWIATRYQEARKPPAGKWVRPTEPPEEDPCYIPGLPVRLVFTALDGVGLPLVFVCERHLDNPPDPSGLIIPALRSYIIVNTASLKRVSDNVPIKFTSASVGTDNSSWCWSFSASLPFSELEKVEPTSSGPVEVELTINTVAFRFLVEEYDDTEVFASRKYNVRGRSVSAFLDTPYAPVRSWLQTTAQTSRQIAEAELTRPGLETGFSLDWDLIDALGWDMPAGTWSFSDLSPIAVLKEIAAGGGGYVNSHPSLREILVRDSYPVASWEWATLDESALVVIPRHFIKSLSLKWMEKPPYDGVRVSGQYTGVTGFYKRAGTAGSIIAPMVSSPFASDADAARNIAKGVLSSAGKQATVSLTMPMDPDYGLFTPGTFIEIVNGGVGSAPAWRGIVRSTEIAVDWGDTRKVQQSVSLERHYGG